MLKFLAGVVVGAVVATMYNDSGYNKEIAESLRRVASKLESTES